MKNIILIIRDVNLCYFLKIFKFKTIILYFWFKMLLKLQHNDNITTLIYR